ncbi:MAG: TlpA family protein disulfide reductase [Bacteroidales bacterium]|nr:TlpA family protein disulfide reductase [Bacteroidales bacterium]
MKSLKLDFWIWCFLCMMLTISPLWAQKITPTQLHGHADFAVGEEIRLIAYEDLLTYTPKVVSTDVVDRNGEFELSYATPEVRLVQLEIRTSRAEFLLEPSKNYEFTITMDEELFKFFRPQDYEGFLQVKNEHADEQDLNHKVNYFSAYYNYAFDRYYFPILFDRSEAARDSVLVLLRQKFDISYKPYDFYQSYIFYGLSQLDRIFWQKETDKLYKKYLDNDHILYNNPNYMEFFNSFYDDYVFSSLKINRENVLTSINDSANYRMLFNELGRDEFLVNERIRELVIIKNLGQLYLNHPEFDKRNILLLLEELQKTTHFIEHKPLITNMINFIKKFSDNQLVKNVKLKETNGKDFTLNKLKGKWTYLHFFRTDCIECVREMMLIKELQEMHRDSLRCIGVCLDFDKYQLQNFLNKYPQFDWEFVHFNQQYQWLNSLEINSLPDYMLLSPEGNIHERYLPAPADGLANYLSRLLAPSAPQDNNPMFHPRK